MPTNSNADAQLRSGFLNVGDGHQIYWEQSGEPQQTPVLFLHGGPGAGLRTGHRRYFDSQQFTTISFEQRGCGRSRPLITECLDSLNLDARSLDSRSQDFQCQFSIDHLIQDIECLRQHLNIERWYVSGISWGVTLALAYAQSHPTRVQGMVLAAVHTASQAEILWLTETIGAVFPKAWQRFAEAAKASPGQRLIDAYYEQLRSSDPSIRARAAAEWCRWEDVHVSLSPGWQANPKFSDSQFREIFATQVVHYWSQGVTLDGNELKDNLAPINDIPAVLIHGRLDISAPLQTAWQLAKNWSKCQLQVIETEGHGGPVMIKAFGTALSHLKSV